MPSWSRRRVLSAAACGLAALAGCQTGEESAGPPEEPDRNTIEPAAVRRVRDTDGRVIFAQGDAVTDSEEEEDRRRRASHYVASRGAFEEFTWSDTDAGRRLRALADETDFDEQSVYLLSTTVDACHEVRLKSVTRDDDDDPGADFCHGMRPADVACETDDIDTVGFAIRLPYTVSQSTGHSTGMRSGCGHPRRPQPFEATVVPRNGSEES